MGYERDRDDRFRGRGEDENRWQGNRYEREGGSFGNWGSNRSRGDWEDRDRNNAGRGPGSDDRGFFERAGEGVRSWLGGDDDRGGSGRDRGHDEGRGNWNHDRGQDRSRFEGAGGQGGGGGYAGDRQASAGGGGGGAADTWGGSGFGGLDDNGRRFDRIDAGSTGTQGAHPMSSPVDAGYGTGGGIGASGGMGGGSSARSAAIIRQAEQQQGGQSDYHGQQYGQQRSQQSGSGQQFGSGGAQHHHDHHYSEWRQRQIDELDRDYHEYRQEHQSKFEQEFGGWRQKRQSQRQLVGRVTEQMEVLGSDGQRVGTVDKVAGDRIILTKNDENAGGMHHSIPCSWIDTVEDRVTLSKSAQEAMNAWTNEDQNRALFERPDQGSDGPHVLNRSFSGTYEEKKD
ncbi:MAG TPA: DUF2171 domain-containing protein [Allosphingosinicella sp.]|uniref:DUF2171 domain-containing protein n=1 Tax=Allosphingosinicella sp. TaxID=2823234 RepID=UPI002F281CE9